MAIGDAVMGREHEAMPSCRIGPWSPRCPRSTDDLIVALRVHEVEALAVLVEEGVLAVLHEGALDLLGGAVALGDLHAVGDAAHVELGHRRALAGMDVLRRQDDIELAVEIDDVALAEREAMTFTRCFLVTDERPRRQPCAQRSRRLAPH